MVDVTFSKLDPVDDLARVMDLCSRAADYVRLETGKEPDEAFALGQLTNAPPQITRADIFNIGLVDTNGLLLGPMGCLRHHPEPDDWYLGLLLLDPLARRQGLGRKAARHMFDIARQGGGRQIRIAVLEDNVVGLEFWAAMGFEFERLILGDTKENGKTCHVLRQNLGGA